MAWLDLLFKTVAEKGASDLHISSNLKPMLRIDGDMVPIAEHAVITAAQMEQYLKEIAPPFHWDDFGKNHDTDFAYALEGVGRFRCNFFVDANGPGAVFRIIPSKIPTVEQLAIPKSVVELCHLKKGLVLVTGPTGSGKSTTLAALINYINKVRQDHIITIEDPIEFSYTPDRCLINQRQVHSHTESFKKALRAALREDPDIVLIGEMRDLETIEIALETAETGHLVFATLHTNTAASTVDRIIDQFPSGQQNQIRTMLAATLKGVIAQTLCKKIPKGRVAAMEVMIVNSAIAANIRDAKTSQIVSMMQLGKALGMSLMNETLFDYAKNKMIEPMEAFMQAPDKKDMFARLKEIGFVVDLTKFQSQ